MGMVTAPESTGLFTSLSALTEVFTATNVLIIVSISILILLLYSYIVFRSTRSILKYYGAQPIERTEFSLLYSILEELSKKAGVRTPKILAFESEIPKMFIIGSESKSFIAISTSMLEMFDELELEALLAHEIGHIKNKDVSLNTVTAYVAGLIMSFPEFVMWGSLLIGFGQPEDPAPRFFKFVATALVAPLAAILVHLTNPAKRELAADEISIKLTGNPRALAKTIEHLENYIPMQPVTERFNMGHFHLFSTHTQQIRGYQSIFISLFDTHPGFEDRVAHIIKYSNNSEQGFSFSKYSRVPGFFDLRSWKFAIGTSFFSYLLLLLGIIIIIPFVLKGFNRAVVGIVVGVDIGVTLLIIWTAARQSRKSHHLK